MWVCPKCNESLHDYEESCWNCRVKNPAAPADVKADGEHKTSLAHEPKKKCPFCAEEIRAEAIKCRFCGSIVPEAEQKAPPQKKVAGPTAAENGDYIRIPKNIAVIIVVLIMATAAVWGAVMLYRPILNKVSGNKDIGAKGVAYEEIMEYDGKGNVKKTLKTYPQEKGKGK